MYQSVGLVNGNDKSDGIWDFHKNGTFRSKVLDHETFDSHRPTMRNALSLMSLKQEHPDQYLDERTSKNIRNISFL